MIEESIMTKEILLENRTNYHLNNRERSNSKKSQKETCVEFNEKIALKEEMINTSVHSNW